jgi:hypothetical protein
MGGRPNPRFHYRQSRDRYLKQLQKLLGRASKIDALEAFTSPDDSNGSGNYATFTLAADGLASRFSASYPLHAKATTRGIGPIVV